MGQDLLYAARVLAKKPLFTLTAVLSLALGIGANTAVFSLINAMLLRALPFKDPSRLVYLTTVPPSHPDQYQGASVPDYYAWKERVTSFEPIGVANGDERDFGNAENGAPAERISGETFSPEVFSSLGIQPELGRVFTQGEDELDTPAPVVLISHRLWKNRFGSDPNIVNRKIRLDSIDTTIIGVMPDGFKLFGDNNTDFWAPILILKAQTLGSGRFLAVPTRLKAGVSMLHAQAEMDSIAAQLAKERPDRYLDRATKKAWGIRVVSIEEDTSAPVKSRLLLLEGTAGLVLLIACANVAGLLLARASSRRVEVSIRAAIGASRGRVIRQLLTESVLLSAVGGVLGLALAAVSLKGLIALSPPWFPHLQDVTINGSVLAFTAAVSLLAGVIFGIVPAAQASKVDLAGALKESGRGSVTPGSARQRLRSALVTVEIALALVLLVGAGLMINSFLRLKNTNLGCDPTGLLTFQFSMPNCDYIKPIGNYHGFPLLNVSPVPAFTLDRLYQRLQAIPGVVSVAGTTNLPLLGATSINFLIDGRPDPETGAQQDAQSASFLTVTPNYFATMRIPLLQGRDFTDRDTLTAPWVAAINEAMARRFWPGENPIGKRFRWDLGPDEQPREIIAVVQNTPADRHQASQRPIFYVPNVQRPTTDRGPYGFNRTRMWFLLRTNGDPMQLATGARQAVSEIDPDRPAANLRTFESFLGDDLRFERWYMVLLSAFGGVALLLAAVGIYGVMAYTVEQRTHEIGMRMALGASSGSVLGLMLRRAAVLIAAGVVLGLVGAVALTRLMAQQLWGVSATDPPTFASVSILLVIVSLAACFIPTMRASAVDPTIALRYE
jgi:putative ABC transport system permease protein